MSGVSIALVLALAQNPQSGVSPDMLAFRHSIEMIQYREDVRLYERRRTAGTVGAVSGVLFLILGFVALGYAEQVPTHKRGSLDLLGGVLLGGGALNIIVGGAVISSAEKPVKPVSPFSTSRGLSLVRF